MYRGLYESARTDHCYFADCRVHGTKSGTGNSPAFSFCVSLSMEIPAPTGKFWRWLLPLAVVACLYVNYLYNAHPPAGAFSNGEMSARHV
jgi:hypothetical protein